jgi:alpha-beta hydrolase superfamily lysophospholipase
VIRAFTVLASTLRGDASTCEHERIAGVEALVARPRRGSGPVVVYANAMTPLGVEQPGVGRFLAGLARAGFVAVAPELPQVRRGEVTPETIDALVRVGRAAGLSVALVGASTGGGLAILAAGDPRIAHRVTAVAAIAPFASLRNVIRLATTGYYGEQPYSAAPLLASAAARSLAATAPDDPAVPALLANRDPSRFDELYAALEPSTRALVEELSPLARIGDVSAPVEVASSPSDPFFPVEEAHALASAGRDVRLTVTPALLHVVPRLRPGLASVVALLDRTLRRAAERGPLPALRPSVA